MATGSLGSEQLLLCCRQVISKFLMSVLEEFYFGKVINQKWVVESHLGEGCCGVIFRVHHIKDPSRLAAMKVELKEEQIEVLKNEARVIKCLKSRRFVVELFDSGKRFNYSYIIMTLFGPSLSELKRNFNGNFSAGCVCKIGIQCLYAIKQVHEVGYVHRDIKPSNFVIGRRGREARLIYLIDYGLARKFIVKKDDGKYRIRKPRTKARLRGTTRYCSPAVHSRKEQGRRDDLWSLLYFMVELRIGLPWIKKPESETKQIKNDTSDKTLMKDCPPEWIEIMKHIRQLKYETRPNYYLIYKYLSDALLRLNVKLNDPYDWENMPDVSKISSKKPLKKEDKTKEEIDDIENTELSYETTTSQETITTTRSISTSKSTKKSLRPSKISNDVISCDSHNLFPNMMSKEFEINDLKI